MTLIHLDNVTISFHGPPLLDAVSCRLEARQRIGLLGRNGAGKTTFMRLVSGQISPDDGRVVRSPGVRIAQLRQDVPQDVTGTLSEVILSADAFADDATQHDWWHHEQQVEEILTRMNLDSEARFETLSSGMKRRVLLAQAIASDPDLLLLDEPTNHLDVDSILWLEEFLAQWRGALLFVTHDRAFLRRLATRILEIDRGKLFDWSCDYDTFLQRKDELLAAEEKQNALFDKRLAEEERWIRQGIKARRTRNEGRVRALKEMRDQRSQRRDRLGTSNLNIETTRRSGALVAEAEEISFRYNGDERMAESEPIFTNFSTVLMRGDKVGVVGPNGAGKTTLLRVLLGELQPTSGKVKLGTNLDIVYFDQLRGKLDEEETVEHAVGEGYNTIELAGRKKHIYGYLQDFLFTPERARTQIKFLSGGERNRVLLAKLFAKPANVVVLDEPTNDLDAETMEMLEERLIDFPGTLLVVSHDRVFLDNVVSSVIAFEPGGVREYVGGYTEWVRQRDAASKQANQSAQSQSSQPTGKKNTVKTAKPAKAKLSYKDQRELDKLPALIEKLEAELAEQNQTMADPDFYQQPKATIAAKQAEIETLQEKLTAAYARWEALEG